MNNEIIAFCYIHKIGDERNRCNLTRENLQVILKGKPLVFPLRHLQDIRFSIKKLWFPLITGGILASLSTVAFFKNIGNPWLIMVLLLCGLFLFYYGNQGTQIMSLISGNDQTHLFIGKLSPNLRAFSTFTLNYRNPNPRMRHLYLVLEGRAADGVDQTGIHPEMGNSKIKCLSVQQYGSIQVGADETVIEIDPLKVSAEIRYEWDELQNDLFPFIYGSVPPEAIL